MYVVGVQEDCKDDAKPAGIGRNFHLQGETWTLAILFIYFIFLFLFFSLRPCHAWEFPQGCTFPSRPVPPAVWKSSELALSQLKWVIYCHVRGKLVWREKNSLQAPKRKVFQAGVERVDLWLWRSLLGEWKSPVSHLAGPPQLSLTFHLESQEVRFDRSFQPPWVLTFNGHVRLSQEAGLVYALWEIDRS